MAKTVYSAENRKQDEVQRGKRPRKAPAYIPTSEASVKTNEEYLDHLGREKPDDTPVAPPIGYKKQPSMVENIRAMVQRELSLAAQNAGAESFEEADDFDVGDDYDPSSPYEEVFEPEPERVSAPVPSSEATQDPPPSSATPPVASPAGGDASPSPSVSN